MSKFITMLNENLNEKKDADLSDVPPSYQKSLKPYESEIDSAFVDQKTMKTILYINKENASVVDKIKKAVGKDFDSIDTSTGSDGDIKIILK